MSFDLCGCGLDSWSTHNNMDCMSVTHKINTLSLAGLYIQTKD